MDLPNDHRLTDDELAVAAAQALLHDVPNSQAPLTPFQPMWTSLLHRLGLPGRGVDERDWRNKFAAANEVNALNFRLEEFCWRLVGLGFVVPQNSATTFMPTERGRVYLQSFDATLLTAGSFDQKLG